MIPFHTRKATFQAFIVALSPGFALAETLKLFRGDPATAITLATGTEILVETATPFFELAVANPGIAGPSPKTDRQILLSGRQAGRTTLTLLHDPDADRISQVDVLVSPESSSQVPSGPVPLTATHEPQIISVEEVGALPEIRVGVNQSLVLKTDSPFTDVAIDDASHADYSVLSSVGVYLVAKSPGGAKLTLQRQGDGSDTVVHITVE